MDHNSPSSVNTMAGTQMKWINSLVWFKWLSLYCASSVLIALGSVILVSRVFMVLDAAFKFYTGKIGARSVKMRHADRQPDPAHRPRAGHRPRHPHFDLGKFPRRRIAGGAAILCASTQFAVADPVGVDGRAAGAAAVCRTSAAPAGAGLRPVGCAGRLRA